MRGVRYGEVLAVMSRDEKLQADVYGTQMINDCPAELWETLKADEIAKDMGALFVKLNGPRYWMLDGLGTKVAIVEPVMREFNGLMMRRIATVDLGDTPSTVPYQERFVNRGARRTREHLHPAVLIPGPHVILVSIKSAIPNKTTPESQSQTKKNPRCLRNGGSSYWTRNCSALASGCLLFGRSLTCWGLLGGSLTGRSLLRNCLLLGWSLSSCCCNGAGLVQLGCRRHTKGDVLEALECGDLGNSLRSDLDGLTRCWVTAHACGTLDLCEFCKTGKVDDFALSHVGQDDVDRTFNGCCSRLLVDTGVVGYCLDEVTFLHVRKHIS